MVNRIYGLICSRPAGSLEQLKQARPQAPPVTVMRGFSFVALVSFGAVAIHAAPATASVWDDARKVCLERYNDELKSGSVPNRMTKDRYVKQCQASYVRSAKLDEELEDALGPNDGAGDASSFTGQGGPEDLVTPPAAQQPKPAAPARAAKPLPRAKPAN